MYKIFPSETTLIFIVLSEILRTYYTGNSKENGIFESIVKYTVKNFDKWSKV